MSGGSAPSLRDRMRKSPCKCELTTGRESSPWRGQMQISQKRRGKDTRRVGSWLPPTLGMKLSFLAGYPKRLLKLPTIVSVADHPGSVPCLPLTPASPAAPSCSAASSHLLPYHREHTHQLPFCPPSTVCLLQQDGSWLGTATATKGKEGGRGESERPNHPGGCRWGEGNS